MNSSIGSSGEEKVGGDEKEWWGLKIDDVVMANLLTRFILNLPASELNNWNRLFYHLEHMWWFYLDHMVESLTPAQRLHFSNHQPSFLAFSLHALHTLEDDDQLSPEILKKYHTEYEKYKRLTPVAGCALLRINSALSTVEILMVRPAGTSRWVFPKGKQNAGETLFETARRETEEETGFHISTEYLHSTSFCWSTKSNNSDFIHIFPVFLPQNTLPSCLDEKELVKSLEVEEIRWITLGTIQNIMHNHHQNQNHTIPVPLTNLANQLWPKLFTFAKNHLKSHPLPASTESKTPTALSFTSTMDSAVPTTSEKKSPLNAKAPSFTPITTVTTATTANLVSSVIANG